MSVVVVSVERMNPDLVDLDAKALLAAATEAERASRLAEVARLELLSAWASGWRGSRISATRGGVRWFV